MESVSITIDTSVLSFYDLTPLCAYLYCKLRDNLAFGLVWCHVWITFCVCGYKQKDGLMNVGHSGCWKKELRGSRSAGWKETGIWSLKSCSSKWTEFVFVGVCSEGSAEVFLWRKKGVRVGASWQRRSSLLTCVRCLWAEASLVCWLLWGTRLIMGLRTHVGDTWSQKLMTISCFSCCILREKSHYHGS